MNVLNVILGGLVGVLALKKMSNTNTAQQTRATVEETTDEEAVAEALKKAETKTEEIKKIDIYEDSTLKVYATYGGFENKDNGKTYIRSGYLCFENKSTKPIVIYHLMLLQDYYQTTQLGINYKSESRSSIYQDTNLHIKYKWNNSYVASYDLTEPKYSNYGLLVSVATTNSIPFEVYIDTWKPEKTPLVVTDAFDKNPFGIKINYSFNTSDNSKEIVGSFDFPF